MAGTRLTIDYDDADVRSAIGNAMTQLDNPQPLFESIGAGLLNSTQARFRKDGQASPEGIDWAALSPRYAVQKERKRPGQPILSYDGYLQKVVYQVRPDGVEVGSNLPYAARQQFGGTFAIPARQGKARLRTDASGKLLRQGGKGRALNLAVFARKEHKQAVERSFTIPAHSITTPARPFLGVSADDRNEILEQVRDFLNGMM